MGKTHLGIALGVAATEAGYRTYFTSAADMVQSDGSHVQLAPEHRFHPAVAMLVKPEQLPQLTQEQARSWPS